MKPLAGMRVIAVEQYGAGPYGTMFLAALGADVIKVEQAATGGDPARHVGPHRLGPDDSQYFQAWNWQAQHHAGSRIARGQAAARGAGARRRGGGEQSARQSPGAPGPRLRDARPINPAVVCLHISAYGRDNERADWPGYDYLMQAEVGLMSLTGEPDAPPARVGASMVDTTTGLTGMVSAC